MYIFFDKFKDTLEVYGSISAIAKHTDVKPDRLYSHFGRKGLKEMDTKWFRIAKVKVIRMTEEYFTN